LKHTKRNIDKNLLKCEQKSEKSQKCEFFHSIC
jgi:hypothetical protein